MSASDEIWILGIRMTKFGKHADRDTVDLAAEAATGALADAGVSMADIGVLAAGNLMAANAGIGQQLQKQIGQTGIPVYNVANACATGATALRTAIMAVKAGEAKYGMAVGVEKLSGAGLLGAGGKKKESADVWEAKGRYGAVAPIDGLIGTEAMPGVFAQIGTEYGHKYGGTSFELFARISEKNHAHSTLNPLAAYQKKFTLEQIMNDVMIAYPNNRPMCSANCDSAAAVAATAAARGQSVGVGADQRSIRRWLSGFAERQHADPQRRQDRLRAGRYRTERPEPGRIARLLRHRRAGALRQPDAVRAGRCGRLFQHGCDVA
jgi:acetyl-CoA acetyltransferase